MSINCLGCRTYFQEGEKLPAEDLVIEFKNYSLPIKESKSKWIILKTIVAFLNSKGGTIYIGVEDKQGEVIGVNILRKQLDQFKLFLKQLVQRVQPPIDLMDRQQIQVFLVPVVRNKKFIGRSVVKIVVKQGDPSKIYFFAQKLTLQSSDKGRIEQYQILYTFRRHNMGGVEEAKGMKVVQCASKKAAYPNQIAHTFHEDCNPQPLSLEVELTKIAFGGLSKKTIRQKFQKVFHGELEGMDIDYELTYGIDNNIVIIQFSNPQQYKRANDYVIKHLKDLNSQDDGVQFVEKGIFLDYNLFQNIKEPKFKFQQKKISNNQKSSNKNIPNDPYMSDNQKIQNQKQGLKYNFPVTITHIDPQKSKDLLQYLKSLISKASKFTQRIYINSIEFYFENQEDQKTFQIVCSNHFKQLQDYGLNGSIKFGYGTGKIQITNYNKDRRKQLKKFIEKLIGNDLKEIYYKVQKNRYCLELKMKSKPLACKWLDILLNNTELKDSFNIPGSKNGEPEKIKINVHCLGDKC